MDVFGYKINAIHISCAVALFSFITLVLESEGVCSYFVLVFVPKFLVRVTFACLTKPAQVLFWLNRWKSETTAELRRLLPVIVKNVDMSFLNIMLCYYFSLEAILLPWLKLTYRKTNRWLKHDQATLKHGPAWKLTEEYEVYR